MVFEGFIVEGPTAQGVLGAAEKTLFPLLDLGDGQTVLAGGLGRSGLATQDLYHEGDPPLDRPAFEGFVVGCLLVAHQFHLSDYWSVCHSGGLTVQGGSIRTRHTGW
jgi:hypothetical protein